MTDSDLMSKYDLSAAELRVMVGQLLACGHIHTADVENRPCGRRDDCYQIGRQVSPVSTARKRIVDGAEVLRLVRSGNQC